MAAINLKERDGLHSRLFDVRCPVMWLHVSLCSNKSVTQHSPSEQGTNDVVYSVANAQEEIKLFTNSPDAQLITVKDGQHFLSASHPHEVDNALIDFVKKWHK